ncbi:MAG: 7-carboxy-7-deazaguanine synthase QueE [Pseudomonadota bacterium]|jgi:7-carboxy-7-deazaguanine synthase
MPRASPRSAWKKSRQKNTDVLDQESQAVVPASAGSLKISEIFHSLQGETRTVGIPTVFVRLTGCPLRCHYCDTTHAFSGGQRWTLEAIRDEVRRYPVRHVTVTGGEPLAQPACLDLLRMLADEGYEVSLETSGAFPVDQVDSRVVRVFDLKTPDSGEVHRNRLDQLPLLTMRDQVKFVIMSEADYAWAVAVCQEYDLPSHCEVLFSAAEGWLAGRPLAEWILRDGLPVRFQIQLHKILWGDETGR